MGKDAVSAFQTSVMSYSQRRHARREEKGRRTRLTELFKRMDMNSDRILTRQEANRFLMEAGYDRYAIQGFWQTFDINRDWQITADEFNRVLAEIPDDNVDIDRLQRVFRLFDTDNSGRIEIKELKSILTQLGRGDNDELIKGLMALNGISPEGGITFDDFVYIFSNPTFV